MPSLLEIILPTECLICGVIESRICSNCEVHFATNPRMVVRHGLFGFAATDYSPEVRTLIRSFKELGESSVASRMASRMAGLVACFQTSEITLAAVPGNRKSVLERGFNQAEVLAREMQRICPEYGFSRLLHKSRDTRDQSKLKPVERARNLQGSIISEAGRLNVVVIDDIVTTGATMKAAARALQHAGHNFVGFVAFAETETKKV